MNTQLGVIHINMVDLTTLHAYVHAYIHAYIIYVQYMQIAKRTHQHMCEFTCIDTCKYQIRGAKLW